MLSAGEWDSAEGFLGAQGAGLSCRDFDRDSLEVSLDPPSCSISLDGGLDTLPDLVVTSSSSFDEAVMSGVLCTS